MLSIRIFLYACQKYKADTITRSNGVQADERIKFRSTETDECASLWNWRLSDVLRRRQTSAQTLISKRRWPVGLPSGQAECGRQKAPPWCILILVSSKNPMRWMRKFTCFKLPSFGLAGKVRKLLMEESSYEKNIGFLSVFSFSFLHGTFTRVKLRNSPSLLCSWRLWTNNKTGRDWKIGLRREGFDDDVKSWMETERADSSTLSLSQCCKSAKKKNK